MKQHTIIIVPHARAKFRKVRVTSRQIGLVLAALGLLTLGSIYVTASYFSNRIDRDQLVRIQEENSALREVNQRFESNIHDLQSKLDEYQESIHKLAIVAGLAELSPSDAGIGGSESTGLDMEGRGDRGWTDDLRSLEARARDLEKGMVRLQVKLGERAQLISSTPAISPVKGILTSSFGPRRDPFTRRPSYHNGIDIVAPPGKEVRATADGIVTKAARLADLGKGVFVNHGYGITTRYGHLSRFAVSPGDEVKRGQVIGYVGNTGRSTGYHLHYEVRVDSRPVDPRTYILDGIRP